MLSRSRSDLAVVSLQQVHQREAGLPPPLPTRCTPASALPALCLSPHLALSLHISWHHTELRKALDACS